MPERVLVVDDEAVLRRNVVKFLRAEGFDAVGAESGREAVEILALQDCAVVITDLKMPGMSGLELLRHVAIGHPETMVLIITAYASLESAVDALRLGAQDYLLKPLRLGEVARKVSFLLHHRALQLRVRRLRQELHGFDPAEMVAESPAMREILRVVRQVAQTPSTVLIEGESGTGKELVARALHAGSPRSGQDFIAIHLAAQPPNLVDGALFGRERGAYAGAAQQRAGVFRAADGGTVFLDEVGELPADVQVKLLRVLESREVLPLGSDRAVPVDFRLVAATNKRLSALVEQDRFRQDLYFRLNVMRIELPPLRARPQDIAPLATRFLHKHATALGRPVPRFTNEALRKLHTYPWPGNVRELSNVIERSVLLATGPWLDASELPPDLRDEAPEIMELKPAREAFERAHVARVLARTGGDKVRAAELLGVHLATLYRLLERLEIEDLS